MKTQKNRVSKDLKLLIILIIYLVFCQIAYAQTGTALSRPTRVGELLFLVYLWWRIFRKRNRKLEKRQKRILLLFGSLIIPNLLGCVFTYGIKGVMIFVESSYDYLKYATITCFILKSQLTKRDIKALLDSVSVIIWISTLFSVLQFVGFRWAFAPFQGRFGIYARNGMFRTIGIFAYSIEYGNFLSILFAYYISYTKSEKNKYYTILVIVILIDTIMSGSRTSLVCEAIILIVSHLDGVKNWLRGVLLAIVGLLIISNFWDFGTFIDSFSSYINESTPRTYYLVKGIDVWKDNPFVGIGFETYGTKKFRDDTNDLIFDKYNLHEWDWANLASTDVFYAQILPEFGIIGLAILIAIVYNILKQTRRCKSNRNYIFVVIGALILCMNSSSALFSPHVGSFVWISLGFLLISDRQLQGPMYYKQLRIS